MYGRRRTTATDNFDEHNQGITDYTNMLETNNNDDNNNNQVIQLPLKSPIDDKVTGSRKCEGMKMLLKRG